MKPVRLFQAIAFLTAIWSTLKQHLNIEEIGKEGLKDALSRFKDLFGFTRITPERTEKFFQTAEIVKEMGGIDALHEGLTELKKAGMLDQFASLYDEKEGTNSAGGLARSQVEGVIIDINKPKGTTTTLNEKGLRVIEVAKAEVGQVESPANSNLTKYGEWFGWNGVAWCGIFVSWVYAMARVPLPNIGFTKGFAGCMTAVEYFRKSNSITSNPMPGDLVFFDWNKDKRFDHVGIFLGFVDDGRDVFRTIEGNTSATNQSNGGQVQLRERSGRASYSVLFVHPKVLD